MSMTSSGILKMKTKLDLLQKVIFLGSESTIPYVVWQGLGSDLLYLHTVPYSAAFLIEIVWIRIKCGRNETEKDKFLCFHFYNLHLSKKGDLPT
jgi:hypothetical protein